MATDHFVPPFLTIEEKSYTNNTVHKNQDTDTTVKENQETNNTVEENHDTSLATEGNHDTNTTTEGNHDTKITTEENPTVVENKETSESLERSQHSNTTVAEGGLQLMINTSWQDSNTDELNTLTNDNNDTIGGPRVFDCSLVKHLNLILALGKKMPLYVEVIAVVIAVLGIIGNIATVITIIVNMKLRKPYFLALLSLAIADLFALIQSSVILFYEFEVFMYLQCLKPTFVINIAIMISVEMNAILNILLIAVVKFLLLVYPIKSKTCLTNQLVILMCPAMMAASLCYGFASSFGMMLLPLDSERLLTQIPVQVISTVLPCLFIIVMHIIKVVKMGKSKALQKEVKTMNSVLVCIISIFLVFNLLKIINPLVNTFTRNILISQILHITITIAALFNHAANPYIYLAFTPLVQVPLQRFLERFRTRK
ncbi:G-protein coupled receptor 12-like [Saccostrea cucullata]|uniref:G-protein coupled receptor 12-like n=1 Tax=Saccostrea cuccullata TaxID=36930 RepID=UPI002ED12513